MGDYKSSFKLILEALKALKDKDFLPQVRSELTVEKLKREYSELNDMPPATSNNFSELDKARAIIACYMDIVVNFGLLNYKSEVMQEFNLIQTR